MPPFNRNSPPQPIQGDQVVPYEINGAPVGGTSVSSATTGAVISTKTAGEALGGHRAVYIATDGKAYYAGPAVHARQCIGITTGAASLGAAATIQTDGEITEPSWSWTDNEVVWLAATGLLTQTVPTTGIAFQVGVPMGPTRLRIEPQLIAQLV